MDKKTYIALLQKWFHGEKEKKRIKSINFKKNNCIGALCNPEQFKTFSKNFELRIERLLDFCQTKEERKTILKNLIDLASTDEYNWAGPYSELIAIDYFLNSNKYIDDFRFPFKETVKKAPLSIAKECAQQTLDIDLLIEIKGKELYIDIKSFIPTYRWIIENIISRVKSKITSKNFEICIVGANGGNFCDDTKILSKNKNIIIKKLCNAIKNNEESVSFKKYQFQIAYPKRNGYSFSPMDLFDPYLIAKNYYKKVLIYYNKLLIEESSLLCFVINPWFNEDLNDPFPGNNFSQTLYRSFARRVFMSLTKENSELSKYININNQKVPNTLKVSDIACKITGLIFIEDKSTSKFFDEDNNIYDTYIFLNPNATNKKLSECDLNFLYGNKRTTPVLIDDFKFDNY